jgi:hypothetical protein
MNATVAQLKNCSKLQKQQTTIKINTLKAVPSITMHS